jgi:hypothetical protein
MCQVLLLSKIPSWTTAAVPEAHLGSRVYIPVGLLAAVGLIGIMAI